MKRGVSKKILEYTVIFEPAEEGGYVATVPALNSCATQGETFEEAVANIKDAIQGVISVMEKEGIEIPQEMPQTIVTKVAISHPVTTT